MNEDINEFRYHRVTREGVIVSTEPVAVEKRFSLFINGNLKEIFTATPTDLEDLVVGRVFSSDSIRPQDIISVNVSGDRVDVELNERKIKNTTVPGARLPYDLRITRDFVFRALNHLETEAYRKTSGVHSSTVLNEAGEVVVRGVDVRRINAYDKAIGKLLLTGIDPARCVLLASGRQSRELVMRAAKAGIPVTISKAAPISSGIEAALETGMTLICFADQNKFSVFAGIERLIL